MTRTRSDVSGPAAGWAAHLRDGGTTPWHRWVREADSDGSASDRPAADPRGGPSDIPGAAQLELLRRLNLLGPLPHRVDHVLSRPGPGRGPMHLPLADSGRTAPRAEVLRVASGVLADLTAELVPSRRRRFGRRPAAPRPLEGVPRFVLEGPPLTVAELEARLTAVGLAPHRPPFSWLGARPDPGPELAVVVARPLDEALREVWSSRVQRGAARPWRRFVTQWAGRRTLPPAPALDRTVDHWAGRIGAADVHVVVAEPGLDPVVAVTRLLGATPEVQARAAAEPPWPPDPARLAPAAVDALRRVNAVLPFLCSPAEQESRRAVLVRLARGTEAGGEPPDLPERHRGWARANADRIVDALQQSGCTVHGDLDALRVVSPPTGSRIDGAQVLDVMVRMIHRVDAELAARSRGGRGAR